NQSATAAALFRRSDMGYPVGAVYDRPRLHDCGIVGGPRPPLQGLLIIGLPVLLSATSSAIAANTTLLEAAESGDRATAMRLLGQGANPNTQSADGATAVMYASANADLDLVRALIKAGANVKLKNRFGTSALTEAAIIGSAPIIEALLKAGGDPNTKSPEGATPLTAVARRGELEAAKRRLEGRA